MIESDGDVVVRLERADHFRASVTARGHDSTVDEPRELGGSDEGMTPYELMSAAIGSCTAITLRMYADRKQWPLESVEVRLTHGRTHEADCEACEEEEVGIDRVALQLSLGGPLTPEQRARLAEIAGRCPVKQTLERGMKVVIETA